MKHYWMAFCNDGVELTGLERENKEDAIKDCKECFRFDYAECGEAPDFDYYIEEYYESDTEIIVGWKQAIYMTMGVRGGVKVRKGALE